MLFDVFINDPFYFALECKLYNYADDNTLSKVRCTTKEVLDSLVVDACNATRWFTSNLMKANSEKFQVMLLSPMRLVNQFPNTFKFEDLCVKRESTCKLLGIILDDGLRFAKNTLIPSVSKHQDS